MKLQPCNNNLTFGNTKGGVVPLKIISDGRNGLRFIKVPSEDATVKVFVAGGPEVDKRVRSANLKSLQYEIASNSINPKRKLGLLGYLKKIFS